jgi:hypothetical protein
METYTNMLNELQNEKINIRKELNTKILQLEQKIKEKDKQLKENEELKARPTVVNNYYSDSDDGFPCQIFKVTNIVFDNPFLNWSEEVQNDFAKTLNINWNEALDLTHCNPEKIEAYNACNGKIAETVNDYY